MEIGKIRNVELVEYFGSDKNKETYKRLNKISNGTKQALLNKAKRRCNIFDLGNGEYEIKEIYEKEIPKAIFSLQESEAYSVLAPIIINKLICSRNNNENVLTMSLISCYDIMRIVNKDNYNSIRYNKYDAKQTFDLDLTNIECFFNVANEKLRYYFEECLNLLKKSEIISWQRVRAVKIRNVQLINSYDKVQTIINSDHRVATREEIRFIEDCKTTVCLEFDGIDRWRIPFHFHANKRYHELLIERDIVFDYDLYEIYYTDINKSFEFMEMFENFDIIDFSNKFSDFIISNTGLSYSNRNKSEDILKKELDYLFLSKNTLKHDAEKLEVKTIKIKSYGEHHSHVIESYEQL